LFSRFTVQTISVYHIHAIAAPRNTKGPDYQDVYAVVDLPNTQPNGDITYTTTFGTININGTANFTPIGMADLSLYTQISSMVFGDEFVAPYVIINARRADHTLWFVVIDVRSGEISEEWAKAPLASGTSEKSVDLVYLQ
jgi:hypothetical protein